VLNTEEIAGCALNKTKVGSALSRVVIADSMLFTEKYSNY